MTWTIPLEAGMEATTLASLIETRSPSRWRVALAPLAMPSVWPSRKLSTRSAEVVTWYWRILRRASPFSGSSSFSTVPGGSLSKAALVGANTVSGPEAATDVT
jgi:hypothetical protein